MSTRLGIELKLTISKLDLFVTLCNLNGRSLTLIQKYIYYFSLWKQLNGSEITAPEHTPHGYNWLKLDTTLVLVLEGYLYYFKVYMTYLKIFMFVLFNPNLLLQKMQSVWKMVGSLGEAVMIILS